MSLLLQSGDMAALRCTPVKVNCMGWQAFCMFCKLSVTPSFTEDGLVLISTTTMSNVALTLLMRKALHQPLHTEVLDTAASY